MESCHQTFLGEFRKKSAGTNFRHLKKSFLPLLFAEVSEDYILLSKMENQNKTFGTMKLVFKTDKEVLTEENVEVGGTGITNKEFAKLIKLKFTDLGMYGDRFSNSYLVRVMLHALEAIFSPALDGVQFFSSQDINIIPLMIEFKKSDNPPDMRSLTFKDLREIVRFKLTTEAEELKNVFQYFFILLEHSAKMIQRSRGDEKISQESQELTDIIMTIIINLTGISKVSQNEILDHKELLEFLKKLWFNQQHKNHETSFLIIRNISRTEDQVDMLLKDIPNIISDTVDLITSNKHSILLKDYAHILLNLTLSNVTRKILLKDKGRMLLKVLPFMKDDTVQAYTKLEIAKVLKNCLLDEERPELEDKESELLHYILWPLVDGTEFSEEDNEKFPIDLQYLPSTKLREQNQELIEIMVCCISLLAKSKHNRNVLRQCNSYLFFRELHKVPEISDDTTEMIEMLVSSVFLNDEE